MIGARPQKEAKQEALLTDRLDKTACRRDKAPKMTSVTPSMQGKTHPTYQPGQILCRPFWFPTDFKWAANYVGDMAATLKHKHTIHKVASNPSRGLQSKTKMDGDCEYIESG